MPERRYSGLRVGYFPKWMNEAPATDVDRAALEAVKKVGMVPVEVAIPDWPYDSLQLILFAEAAAAFEELTLTHGVDQLKMQVPDAWPNSFRQARFLSAVDFVQTDRFRRKVANEMGACFLQGGPASGSLPARRDAHHHQLHGPPLAHVACGFHRGF